MKLLIFDIDGTLTYLDGATRRAFDTAFDRIFGVRIAIEKLALHGRLDPLIIRDCFRQCGLEQHYEEVFPKFRETYLKELPKSLAATPQARLQPGVLELLDILEQQPERVALALGTGNMEGGARIKIGHFGLNRYFPVGGFGDLREQRSDVIRDAIVSAESHYGRTFDPAETWVIGDTPYDIEAGKLCGVKTLGVATGGAYTFEQLVEAGADVVFPDLADTAAVLEALGLR